MRISHQTRLLLNVLLDSPAYENYGFELARVSGLQSGTIYPLLRRLEESGCVTSRWEEVDPSAAGRRRRRYYRLTGEGERVARAAVAGDRDALRQLTPGWSAA
jgi:DNA-binding PadR family transcriptional regulator